MKKAVLESTLCMSPRWIRVKVCLETNSERALKARPRDPPDAVPLQQIQNRGNGKNLYRASPFAEFKLAPAPGADNPENRVDTATFVRGQTHLMLRSKGPLTRPRDSKLNRNLSSSGRNRRWGSSICSD